jgi:hypothetical protein
LGGGDDRLILSTGGRRINVPVDEGAGHDRFELQAKHEARQIVVDLRRSRYAIEDGPRGRLHGVEDAYVNGNDVRLLGTYGADTLGVVACTAGLIDAGGGDDVATMFVRPGRFCDHTVPRILGGPGNDVLTGSRVHDLVIGGPGDDTANGLGGRDTCRSVESATRCERR